MNLKELTPDLFDDGVPTVIEGNDNIEKNQILKPAYMKKGLIGQVLFVNTDGEIEKTVVCGFFEKGYCDEIIFSVKPKKDIEDIVFANLNGKGNLPPDFPRPTEAEVNEFRKYINRFNWITARTFENFSPHQYIRNFPCWKMKEDGKCNGFCQSCKEQRAEFEKWVLFIRKYGERQKMLRTVYTVFCVDDKQYWTMGDPMNTTWILNRALIDDPRRKPRLYWLDRI